MGKIFFSIEFEVDDIFGFYICYFVGVESKNFIIFFLLIIIIIIIEVIIIRVIVLFFLIT